MKNNILIILMLLFYKTGNSQTITQNDTPNSVVTFYKKRCYKVTYFLDGSIESRGMKTKPRGRDGKWKFYYKTGIVKAIGKYKNGKKKGKWLYFDENGKLVKEEYYSIK